MNIALVVLSQRGLDIARHLQPHLDGAVVHGLAGRVDGSDVPFAAASGHLQDLFDQRTAIVGICASGILIRALAPVLGEKGDEPPVVALADDGSVAVPLLGGHHGANRLARRIAGVLEGIAAITTAGDIGLGLALDEPPQGWVVANPDSAKTLTAALLHGESVRLEVEAGDRSWPDETPFDEEGELALLVTDRAGHTNDSTLVVHPPVLGVGVGCERGATAAELRELLEDTLAEAGLAPGAIAAIATIDLKADEEAIAVLAEMHGLPARFFTAEELEAEAARLANPSGIVFREVGCHGVAEGAALALAGPASELIVPKRKSARATCAIARSPKPIDVQHAGRPRGRLAVVGIGPGAEAWRTPEATNALAMADEVVGYGLYLSIVDSLIAGKPRHGSALGAEEERVRMALDLAAEGRSVALVCSGDPGIYALATLAFELINREARDDWRRIDVAVVPGISALQAAAARAGAPLGHDFCAISLSDLLTPRAAIVERLKAAASADFVVALYNPQSGTRRELLPEAKRILASARAAETPVVVARNLGRGDESVTLATLGDFDTEAVDMFTLVIVGSSQTRTTATGRVFTPRGYGEKNQGGGSLE